MSDLTYSSTDLTEAHTSDFTGIWAAPVNATLNIARRGAIVTVQFPPILAASIGGVLMQMTTPLPAHFRPTITGTVVGYTLSASSAVEGAGAFEVTTGGDFQIYQTTNKTIAWTIGAAGGVLPSFITYSV